MDYEPPEKKSPTPNNPQKPAIRPGTPKETARNTKPIKNEIISKKNIVFEKGVSRPKTPSNGEKIQIGTEIAKIKADLIDFSKSDFVACENVFGVWNDFPVNREDFANLK